MTILARLTGEPTTSLSVTIECFIVTLLISVVLVVIAAKLGLPQPIRLVPSFLALSISVSYYARIFNSAD